MIGFDKGELALLYQHGHVSAPQLTTLKEKLGEWFYIETTGPNNHTLVNTWSQRKLLEPEYPISQLNLWDLNLQPGEGVGPLGKRVPALRCMHIILVEKDFWVLKFMMPDSLRKKYIDRGYQFSDYVLNKAAQRRLDFWSNPFADENLDRQVVMVEKLGERERYVLRFNSVE